MSNWLKQTHPEYSGKAFKWVYTQDHYKGDIVNGTESTDPNPTKIDTYLIKRSQGESDAAFSERKSLSDYTPYFGLIVDSFAGMLFQNDDKTQRVWFDKDSPALGLGDNNEVSSLAWNMQENANGTGKTWETLFRQATIKLIEKQEVFVLVEGKTNTSNQASVKIINPLDVYDWIEENGKLTQVKVMEKSYERGDISQNSILREFAIVYSLDGWERFSVDNEGNTISINSGSYYFEDSAGSQILPIFKVQLPLERNISYLLARKNNVIFNKESDRDHLLRVANFPKMVLIANDNDYKNITGKLAAGSNAIQQNPQNSASTAIHTYISPPTAPAEIASKVIREKIEDFFVSGFKEYSNAARQASATEIRQDTAEGVGAFLTLLSAAMDEMENKAVWLVEQVYYPLYSFEDGVRTREPESIKQNWGKAYIKRSTDFSWIDEKLLIKELKSAVFGNNEVPSGNTGKIEAAKKILEYFNISYKDDEISLQVESDSAAAAQTIDINRFLGA